MVTIDSCDEKTAAQLTKAIVKACFGQRISFVFESGTHRIDDAGQLFEEPNGTLTIRIFVNGGAKDSGVPVDKKPADMSTVLVG